MPVKISITTTIGTSKAKPKAKNIFITKSKYSAMSVAIVTPSGAVVDRNSNISGKTT